MGEERRRARTRTTAASGIAMTFGVFAPMASMAAIATTGACGHGAGEGPSDAYVQPETYHPDAACEVDIDEPPIAPASHVPVGTAITWATNPPSSGEHYPVWAAYQSYTSPVPRGYYVHDEEHGGIVLLYNCAAGAIDCATIEASLQSVSDALPDDPLCTAAGEGVRVRTVITPDPLLDVPVAAAAWGWTYRAQCFDLASLVDFARAHYGQGREVLCANGQATF